MDKKILIAGAGIVGIISIVSLAVGFIVGKGVVNKSSLQPSTQPQPSTQVLGEQKEASMSAKTYTKAPEMTIDQNKTYTATVTTSKGVMTLELYASENPVTVNNFVFLAREGFYTNTVFHRIIKGFMIQGGDPKGSGTGGPGYKFADEPVTREYTRGTIAMANAGPNTNGSQFFIMHADYDLPKNYVIFGKVTAGLEVVDSIANTPVAANNFGESSTPSEKVTIEKVEIKE